jgi:hypothetical protein
MIPKEDIDSTFMIGNALERFTILSQNPCHNLTILDWGPWYNGWMEGRFRMLADLKIYEEP